MRKRFFLQYRILPILFLLAISLPYLNKYFPIVKFVKSNENRSLAEKPIFDVNLLDPFPEEYEIYFNDNFSLRNNFNRLYNYWRFEYLGINPLPNKVVIGNDNWLFFNTTMTPRNRINNLLSHEELNTIKDELLSREDYLNKHKCSLYIGVIPAKPSIYYDKLNEPFYKTEYDTIPTIGDQFVSYMNSTTDLKILNFRPLLLDYKKDYKIYHKFDHHCNQLGGFFMAKEMLEFIQKDYPNIDMKISLDDFDIEYKDDYGGNLSKMLGVDDYCKEEKPYLKPKDEKRKLIIGESMNYPFPMDFKYTTEYEERRINENNSSLKCMIIRDSFGNYYKEFLSYGFNNSLYLWDKWEYQINKDVFINEKPDIMIIMIMESFIRKFENKSK